MSVKPGDLAITHKPGAPAHGRIVEVLYAAPGGYGEHYTLPDGHPAVRTDRGAAWIVRMVGAPVRIKLTVSGARHAWFVCVADKYLRPLPGDEPPAEVERPADLAPEGQP